MNTEYIEFVRSRAKPGADILATLTPEKAHLLHMAIGISGEAAELIGATTAENYNEELGDGIFYAVGATFAFLSWTEEDWITSRDCVNSPYWTLPTREISLVVAAGNFLDLVKKYTIYNKTPDVVQLKTALQFVLYELQRCAQGNNVTFDQLIQENIAKLTKRYANGYSDKAAQERADKVDGE